MVSVVLITGAIEPTAHNEADEPSASVDRRSGPSSLSQGLKHILVCAHVTVVRRHGGPGHRAGGKESRRFEPSLRTGISTIPSLVTGVNVRKGINCFDTVKPTAVLGIAVILKQDRNVD